MSIKRTFNGATIIKPGAYSKVVVENLTGFPLQPTGAVAIIGEAVGGEPGVLDILSGMDVQSAKARYKSGPIADALELVMNPSRDSRIPNGASKVVVYKTNKGTQGTKVLKSASTADMLALTTKNYGDDENGVSVLVSEGALAGSNALMLGTIEGPFTLVGGETLVLKISGSTYTFTGTATGSANAAAVVADLMNAAHWAPSKPVIATAVGAKVQIEVDTVALPGAARDKGSMFVDPISTIETILGFSGVVRGKKGSRVFTVRKDTFEEVSPELGGLDQIAVQYIGAGTGCTLSLQMVTGAFKLTTTCAGASADDLDIVLVSDAGVNKHTMKSLVDFLNQSGKYVATCVALNPYTNASALDFYSAIEIKSSALGLRADMAAMLTWLNTYSTLASGVELDNVDGELAVLSSPLFFTGASDGVSTNSDYADGFEAFKEERIATVVPLISKDIGSVTIDSVNMLAISHAQWGWSTLGKSERHAFISKLGSKQEFKDAARAGNSGYATIFGEDIQVLDKNSNLIWQDPWAAACIAAGMRSGAEVGEPLTHKIINVNGVRVRDGSWNPRKDASEMLDAGCCVIEPLDSGGFRIVLGNTTYGVDASFVWNRESVVQAAGYVAYDLRTNLEATFTGTKAKTGTAQAMANFIKARMSSYLGADIIVGDDLNDGLGYKNLRVSIEGNTAVVNVSITPVQGVDFILPTIYLADIRQSA